MLMKKWIKNKIAKGDITIDTDQIIMSLTDEEKQDAINY